MPVVRVAWSCDIKVHCIMPTAWSKCQGIRKHDKTSLPTISQALPQDVYYYKLSNKSYQWVAELHNLLYFNICDLASLRKFSLKCIWERTINSPPLSATYKCQWTGPTLVQITACRLICTKPLSKSMLEYSLLDPQEQTSVKFESKHKTLHSWKMSSGKWRTFCSGEELNTKHIYRASKCVH